MNEQVGNLLTGQLYTDAKAWIPTLWEKLKTPIKKSKAKHFESPSAVLDALKLNEIQPDTWITVECKPFLFGPFLRRHFLSPVIGSHTDMRLGPRVSSNNPVLAIIGQATTHLKPVGLYPPIDDDLQQICLYPSVTDFCGMIGLLPGIGEFVEYLPAVASSRNLIHAGVACKVTGIIRQVPPKSVTDKGIPIESWEELRQKGSIWFLDLTNDYAECDPFEPVVTTEMWGAMYASGHLEIKSGELTIQSIVDAIAAAFESNSFESHVVENKAGNKEIGIYAKGIRALLSSQVPVFSVHMDAELAIDYQANRARFDSICGALLGNVSEACQGQSVELDNPFDLDFSYTDSTNAFTVLKSVGAEKIDDPLAIAIRDWHRKRGK